MFVRYDEGVMDREDRDKGLPVGNPDTATLKALGVR